VQVLTSVNSNKTTNVESSKLVDGIIDRRIFFDCVVNRVVSRSGEGIVPQSFPCHQSNEQMELQEPHGMRSGGRHERTWLKVKKLELWIFKAKNGRARTFRGKSGAGLLRHRINTSTSSNESSFRFFGHLRTCRMTTTMTLPSLPGGTNPWI
jgi:hypothetical protein